MDEICTVLIFVIGIICACLKWRMYVSETDEEVQCPTEKKRSDHPVMGHILLWGPPGVGKTTLARVTSEELGFAYGYCPKFIVRTPIALSSKRDLDQLVGEIEYGTVVFIDEIHGLSSNVEEALYSLMQDFEYQGAGEVPKFTLIGATTRAGSLSKPILDRFRIEFELEEPSSDEVLSVLLDVKNGISSPVTMDEYHGQTAAKTIIKFHIASLTMPDREPPDDILKMIAERSLGNPRIGKSLYEHVKAVTRVAEDKMDIKYAQEMLGLLGIDEMGMHRADRRVVQVFLDNDNHPLGLETLAIMADVHKDDLQNVIEPRLMKLGILERTPAGRRLVE